MLADLFLVLYMPAEAAMIADISVSSTRGRTFGIVRVAHPIGSIVAPLVGGFILDSFGWNAVFYAIVFSAVLALIPGFALTETKKKMKRDSSLNKKRSLRKRIDFNFLYPMLIFCVFSIFNGMGQGLSQITPIYLRERFNVTSFQQGLFFSIGTMIPWLTTSILGGWLADKYSRRKIIIACIIVHPFLMVLWPSMDTYPSLVFLRSLLSFVGFLSMPASQAYLMDYTDESKRGLASGISQLGGNLGGRMIGTPLLGYVYENQGLVLPFYAAALFPLPAIPILMLLKEKNKEEE
jgi:MFS family permease